MIDYINAQANFGNIPKNEIYTPKYPVIALREKLLGGHNAEDQGSSIHPHEMGTQLHRGELIEVLEHYNQWAFVDVKSYKYQGYVLQNQLEKANVHKQRPALDPLFSQVVNRICSLPVALQIEVSDARVQDILDAYKDIPYFRGGSTPAGLDCSGLTKLIQEHLGYRHAERNAGTQRADPHMQTISKLVDAKAGDTIFFSNPQRGITDRPAHVAILQGKGSMPNTWVIFHSVDGENNAGHEGCDLTAGGTRYDLLDEKGIFKEGSQGERWYTYPLFGIKRLPETNP